MSNNKFTFKTVAERFMSHVAVLPNGCWLWTGSLSKGGYGRFQLNGNQIRNPRAAWLVQRGPIPEGLEPDHLCRFRPCVNCDHMELVTHRINCQRGNAGKHLRERTHCPKGHPYSGDNLKVKTTGARKCRECERMYFERKRRSRGAQPRATTCPKGHLFTPENTRLFRHVGRTQRLCIACERIRNVRYRLLRHATLNSDKT